VVPEREAAGHHWLTYEAPPECPQADYIEQKVLDWLKGPIPVASELSAKGEVRWVGGKWEVTVDLESRGARGLRKIAVDQCLEAADFVAVTVVLAVDPSFVIETDAPELEDESSLSPKTPAPSSELGSDPAQQQEEEPQPQRTSSRQKTERRIGDHLLSVESTLTGTSGIFPRFAWGLGGRMGFQTGIWEFMGGLAALPSVAIEQAGATSAVDYSLVAGLLGVCTRFSGKLLYGGPCVGGWLGQLSTSSLNLDSSVRQTEQLWASLQAGVRGGLHLGSFVDVFTGVHFSLPLTQPSLLLDDQSTEIHRPGPGALVELGLRFAWPIGHRPR
jgi:hypothetical protein